MDAIIDQLKNEIDSIKTIKRTFEADGTIAFGDIKKFKTTLDEHVSNFNRLNDIMNLYSEIIQLQSTIYTAGIDRINTTISGLTGQVGAISGSVYEVDINYTIVDYIDDSYNNDQPKQIIFDSKTGSVDTLALPAIIVKSTRDIRPDGQLYFIELINKFAFRLAGELFIGNIGELYTHEKFPKKIKTCSRGNSCANKESCAFYHPATKDVRNFVANSFVYSPNDTSAGLRHFGSRSCIHSDIKRVNNEEVSRVCDQVVHDILGTLLLKKHCHQNGRSQ